MKAKLILSKEINPIGKKYLTFDEVREILSRFTVFYCKGEVFHDTISGRGWEGFRDAWVAFADKSSIKPFKTEKDLATYLLSKKPVKEDFVDLDRAEITLTLQVDY